MQTEAQLNVNWSEATSRTHRDFAGVSAETEGAAKTLEALFRGNSHAYVVNNGGGWVAHRRELTTRNFIDHLLGVSRLAIYPLMEDGKLVFFGIDLDKGREVDEANFRTFVEDLLSRLLSAGFEPYVEVSKSRGIHVWLFFQMPIEAGLVLSVVKALLPAAPPGIGIELFPRSGTAGQGSLGTALSLPLFGGSVREGRTVFLDLSLHPYANQWGFLHRIRRMRVELIFRLAEEKKLSIAASSPEAFFQKADGTLDVAKYLESHGVKFRLKDQPNRRLFLLEECPFRDEHTTPSSRWESAVIQDAVTGRLGFQCFHNHCSAKTWSDFRRAISGNESLSKFVLKVEGDAVEAQGKISPIKARTVRDHLSNPSPRPPFLVDPILIPGIIGLISAEAKKGKSWFCLQLSFSISTGRGFLGYPVPRPQRVIYVQEEIPVFILEDRIRALEAHFGSPGDNLLIASQQRVNLVDRRHFDRFADFVAEVGPALVILDTWSKVTPGLDCNKAENVCHIFQRIREGIIDRVGCAVIFVHHHGHPMDGDRTFLARGSTAFGAEAQMILQFYPRNRQEKRATILEWITTYAPELPRQLAWWDPETKLWEILEEDADHELSLPLLASVIGGGQGRSRRDVLEELEERLGRDVERSLNRALLTHSTLIRKIKRGREMIYQLTPRGRKFISPESRTTDNGRVRTKGLSVVKSNEFNMLEETTDA